MSGSQDPKDYHIYPFKGESWDEADTPASTGIGNVQAPADTGTGVQRYQEYAKQVQAAVYAQEIADQGGNPTAYVKPEYKGFRAKVQQPEEPLDPLRDPRTGFVGPPPKPSLNFDKQANWYQTNYNPGVAAFNENQLSGSGPDATFAAGLGFTAKERNVPISLLVAGPVEATRDPDSRQILPTAPSGAAAEAQVQYTKGPSATTTTTESIGVEETDAIPLGLVNPELITAGSQLAGRITSGQSRVESLTPDQVAAIQVAAGQMNTTQLAEAQLLATQIQTGAVDTRTLTSTQLANAQIVAAQRQVANARAATLPVSELNAAINTASALAAGQVRPDQLSVDQLNAIQASASRLSPQEVAQAQVTAQLLASGKVRATNLTPAQISAAQLVTAQVMASQALSRKASAAAATVGTAPATVISRPRYSIQNVLANRNNTIVPSPATKTATAAQAVNSTPTLTNQQIANIVQTARVAPTTAVVPRFGTKTTTITRPVTATSQTTQSTQARAATAPITAASQTTATQQLRAATAPTTAAPQTTATQQVRAATAPTTAASQTTATQQVRATAQTSLTTQAQPPSAPTFQQSQTQAQAQPQVQAQTQVQSQPQVQGRPQVQTQYQPQVQGPPQVQTQYQSQAQAQTPPPSQYRAPPQTSVPMQGFPTSQTTGASQSMGIASASTGPQVSGVIYTGSQAPADPNARPFSGLIFTPQPTPGTAPTAQPVSGLIYTSQGDLASFPGEQSASQSSSVNQSSQAPQTSRASVPTQARTTPSARTQTTRQRTITTSQRQTTPQTQTTGTNTSRGSSSAPSSNQTQSSSSTPSDSSAESQTTTASEEQAPTETVTETVTTYDVVPPSVPVISNTVVPSVSPAALKVIAGAVRNVESTDGTISRKQIEELSTIVGTSTTPQTIRTQKVLPNPVAQVSGLPINTPRTGAGAGGQLGSAGSAGAAVRQAGINLPLRGPLGATGKLDGSGGGEYRQQEDVYRAFSGLPPGSVAGFGIAGPPPAIRNATMLMTGALGYGKDEDEDFATAGPAKVLAKLRGTRRDIKAAVAQAQGTTGLTPDILAAVNSVDTEPIETVQDALRQQRESAGADGNEELLPPNPEDYDDQLEDVPDVESEFSEEGSPDEFNVLPEGPTSEPVFPATLLTNVLENSELGQDDVPALPGDEGAPVDTPLDLPLPNTNLAGIDQGTTKFTTQVTNNTSIVLVDSRFRDPQVYAQPTLCTLRLPRVYRNVVGISLTQLKLLTSFYYFSLTKNNTLFQILERDRVFTASDGTTSPAIINNFIRTGTYGITELINELNRQANQMPLFLDYPNGIGDFIVAFKSTGDYGLNFNEAGDYYFNRNTQQFIINPTRDTLTALFWKTRYAGLTTYTQNQIRMAFYYPAIKAAIQDPEFNMGTLLLTPGLGIDPTITTIQDVMFRIVYTFQGIDDPVVTPVVLANITVLDQYRTNHTFRNSLVNKYQFFIDNQNQRVSVTTPSLNTSLVNLLNNQRNKFFAGALQLCNLSGSSYSNLVVNNQRTFAVLQSMYNYEQQGLYDYFAVPWSQYSIQYLTTFSNYVLLRDGLGASGIPANDAEALQSNVITYDTDITYQNSKSEHTIYWPNLGSTTQQTIANINLSSATYNYGVPYNLQNTTFDLNGSLVNSNTSYLNTDTLTNGADFLVPIESGKYTVLKFHSPVRQTLQIETLPRPTAYRVPAWNNLYASQQIQEYFDASYSFKFTVNSPYPPVNTQLYDYAFDNLEKSLLNTLPPWTQANTFQGAPDYTYGLSLAASCNYYPTNITLDVSLFNRVYYGTFFAPKVLNANPDCNYKYKLNLSVLLFNSPTGSIPTRPEQDFQLLLYHDRAAFQADALLPRAENSTFYKYVLPISTTQTSNTLTFYAYPGQQYYVSLRANNFTFGTVYPRIVPWFNDPIPLITQSKDATGLNPAEDPFNSGFINLINSNYNYAINYDPDFIRLPISSNLWATSNVASTLQNYNVGFSNTPIGYDINSVNTDYTAYIPFFSKSQVYDFFPSRIIGIDFYNRFLFQSNSAYNSNNDSFFYTNSLNQIFRPRLANVYNQGNVPIRQQIIAHYYSPTYIPEPPFRQSITSVIQTGAGQVAYTSTLTHKPIPGYEYTTTGNLNLLGGVLGFSFIPQEGVYNVRQISFRTAVIDSVNDPNRDIAYLGVFNFTQVYGFSNLQINISNAITVLKLESTRTYTNNNLDNFSYKGGTYYTYTQDSAFSPLYFPYVTGYTQPTSTMTLQPKDMYMVMAFNNLGKPTTIRGLTGSTVPYPFYNDNFVSSVYLDGASTINNKGVVFPSTLQTSNFPFAVSARTTFQPVDPDITKSKYCLSLPIGTSVLATQKIYPYPALEIYPWSTPENVYGVSANVSNWIMIYDNSFKIYPYNIFQSNRSFQNSTYYFTESDLFTGENDTFYIANASTSNYFSFLGIQLTEQWNYRLVFSQFDPTKGMMEVDTYTYNQYTIVPRGDVMSYTMNNNRQWVLTYVQPSGLTTLYYCLNRTTVQNVPITQLPNRAIHAMDPANNRLYYIILNENGHATSVSRFSFETASAITYTFVGDNIPSYFTGFTVNDSNALFLSEDRISLITTEPGFTNQVFYSDSWDHTLHTITLVAYQGNLTDSSGAELQTGMIVNGFNGGIWVNSFDGQALWANRNTENDLFFTVDAAWQIFYPTQRIVLEKLSNDYNYAGNLDYLGYPEYPRTNIFYYSNPVTYENDTNAKWGNEDSNNFSVAAIGSNGEYFNSFLFNAPLIESSDGNYQYITIRGETPTENSQCLLRFTATNLYNFGYVRIQDIFNEIILYSNDQTRFSPRYGINLSNFNNYFNQSNIVFGRGVIQGFEGSNVPTTNFSDFSYQLQLIYNTYLSNTAIANFVLQYANENISNYIQSQLRFILPQSALQRQNFTDPLTFSLLWKSQLLPQYASLLYNWGLGYNLGFAKRDTGYSTVHQSDSFYKILDDYIYLRLNPEYRMNLVDNTGQENFAITRDSTGAIQNYHGKLLLNNFNSYSQTFVNNPVSFNPPIAKLEQLFFNWVDITGATIDNNDCEWSAAVQITELVTTATLQSAQPALSQPIAVSNNSGGDTMGGIIEGGQVEEVTVEGE